MNVGTIYTWETPKGNLEVLRDQMGTLRLQLSADGNSKSIDQNHIRGIRGTDLED